jgi:hypothetical protein
MPIYGENAEEVLGQKEEAKISYQRAYAFDKTLTEAKKQLIELRIKITNYNFMRCIFATQIVKNADYCPPFSLQILNLDADCKC